MSAIFPVSQAKIDDFGNEQSTEADTQGPVLTFDDTSGAVIDLDLRGTTAEIVTRITDHGELEALATARRDCQVARSDREADQNLAWLRATLLPCHWEWLATQPGGASQALRRLVDEARRADGGQTDRKAAHERTYRFLSGLAGDFRVTRKRSAPCLLVRIKRLRVGWQRGRQTFGTMPLR